MTARVAPWAAVGGFRDSSVYFEGTSSQPQSVDQHFKCFVIHVLRQIPSAVERIVAIDEAAVRGWNLLWNGNSFLFRQADGGGGTVTATLTVAPPAGSTIVIVGAYNSPDLFALVGATAASAAGAGGVTVGIRNLTVGVRPNGYNDPAQSMALGALLSADTGLDAASLEAAHDNITANLRQGRALDTGLAFALDRYWDAGDWVPGTPWVDRIAGQALNLVGSPQRFGVGGRA